MQRSNSLPSRRHLVHICQCESNPNMKNQEALWTHLTAPGLEHLLLVEVGEWFWADGALLLLNDQQVIRLSYQLRMDQSGRIRQLRLDLRGEQQRLVEKWVNEDGEWLEQLSEPEAELTGCLAFDIPQSLVTKSLGLRQLTLNKGESSDLLVASFDPTTLQFKAEECRYTCLDERTEASLFKYENLGRRLNFNLQMDATGMVREVPQLLQRVLIN